MNNKIWLIAAILVAMPGCWCKKEEKESKVKPQLFGQRDEQGNRVGTFTGRKKLIQGNRNNGQNNGYNNNDYPDCDYANPLSTPNDCPPQLVSKASQRRLRRSQKQMQEGVKGAAARQKAGNRR